MKDNIKDFFTTSHNNAEKSSKLNIKSILGQSSIPIRRTLRFAPRENKVISEETYPSILTKMDKSQLVQVTFAALDFIDT